MQDEVIKHTKKIYDTVKSPEHSFAKKVREVLVEIFIIVFAISLSIWLHGWSDHRQQQHEAQEFLMDMREDLSKDLETMQSKKESLSNFLTACLRIINLSPKQLDTATNISLNFSLNTIKANDGNYEGFKSSGKIDHIENKELKKSILEYYEEHLPALYDVDRYHYSKQLEIWELINAQPDKKPLSNPVLKAKIIVDAQIVEALIKVNDKAMEKDNEIRKAIDRELSK